MEPCDAESDNRFENPLYGRGSVSSNKSTKYKYINEGILKESEESYVFIEDYLFSSCSTAAAVILGRNTNGWTKWVNNSGKTLDEVYRK